MLRQKSIRKRVKNIGNKKQYHNNQMGCSRVDTVKRSDLYRELTGYQEAGISLWLNGKPSTSYRIANSVCERTNYMRDYYMDYKNQICGIGFDRIRTERDEAEQNPLCRKLK